MQTSVQGKQMFHSPQLTLPCQMLLLVLRVLLQLLQLLQMHRFGSTSSVLRDGGPSCLQ